MHMHISQSCTWSLMFGCHQFPPLRHKSVFWCSICLHFASSLVGIQYICIRYFQITVSTYDLVIRTEDSPYSTLQYSTVIHYKLNSPGIEYWWGQYFPCLSKPATRPNQPPVPWVLGFSGCKAYEAWCWPPSPPSAAVANGLEIYHHLASVHAEECHGVIINSYQKRTLS